MSELWAELANKLRACEPYQKLRDGMGSTTGLPLSAAAWVADLLASDLGRRLLVVVPHESDALAWLEAAALFGSGARYFPAPPLTPYHDTDVSLQVRAREAVALDSLLAQDCRTFVCTPRALFRRLPSADDFERSVWVLRRGEEAPPEELAGHLSAFGYTRQDLVGEVGDFAVRGGVFDLFPPGARRPVRLDLFGDTIDSLRSFSVDDQRSRDELDEARVLPLSLFRASPDEANALADALVEQLGSKAGPEAAEQLEALRVKGRFSGWEAYLPALARDTRDLSELRESVLIAVFDRSALTGEIEAYRQRREADHELRTEQGRWVLPPETVEQPAGRVEEIVAGAALSFGDLSGDRGTDFAGAVTDSFHGQLPRFPREVETAAARRERLVVVTQPDHRSRIEQLCETYGLDGVHVESGSLSRGFRLPPAGVVIYGEPQLFPRASAPPVARPRRARYGPFVTGLRDLRVGDYVVHSDHGIGRFGALRVVGGDAGEGDSAPTHLSDGPQAPGAVEVMELEYGGGKTLLLPLTRMDLIQKYSGLEGVAPKLDQLGGSSWNRTKSRVRAGMRKLAFNLLKLYAERQVAKAPAMSAASDLQSQFDAAFDHEETPDQLEAIAAISEDLERERPMDRLLCGDVGFGKTEVAMRAAFKAVDNGYQVAVLAPTTILADQHLGTFRRRLTEFPVTVEMISRFRKPAEVKKIRERLANGEVDILIGTHRLLSQDIDIPRLGLLIVDEEQRFGVAQKERLKKLKSSVHVLALTATPVPRTLQLSLAGVRDLSVIETPPRDRMAIETQIVPFSCELIREAIEAELERDGQVYFVYNRVEGIEGMASYLRELLPELRLTVGHGQMDEGELASRMHAFKRGEYDLLLATTIIENGIDISNVNTMIVHRADRFGLAQLYQLRGRVGRSNLLAYCYLTVPSDRILSEVARKRLQAIREFSELGAGFRVAARDLEIRGAGNLLGAEQSGHLAAVGLETYLKMLEDTVRELKGEVVEEAPSTALDLPIDATIPTEYVADTNLRMELYRRIGSGAEGSKEVLAELRDRFGPPPEAVERLVEVATLKRLAESLRVQSISARGSQVRIRLRQDTLVDVDRLIELVSRTEGASFSPTGVLALEGLAPAELVAVTRGTLEQLA